VAAIMQLWTPPSCRRRRVAAFREGRSWSFPLLSA
jgi:hypothetical protein